MKRGYTHSDTSLKSCGLRVTIRGGHQYDHSLILPGFRMFGRVTRGIVYARRRLALYRLHLLIISPRSYLPPRHLQFHGSRVPKRKRKHVGAIHRGTNTTLWYERKFGHWKSWRTSLPRPSMRIRLYAEMYGSFGNSNFSVDSSFVGIYTAHADEEKRVTENLSCCFVY